MSDPNTQANSRPCPSCQKPLEDGIRFCPHCGTPLTETSATCDSATPTGDRRSVARDLDLPVTIRDRWRLEEMRGGGGMAKVYRAVDITLEREVAVKLINPDLRNDPEFDARFKREAKIVSQLADPHIVVVHDFDIDEKLGPYLVMEYLQGQSLRERLQDGGPLPLKAALQLAGQMLLALIHAHSKNIVHRDIKPDNIFLLNQSGVRLHTRVLDFGIARIYRSDDPSNAQTITQAGAVLGTPRYMSPEQLAGQPVDARSDLYSAAQVIFEALTGQVPFPGGKKLTEQCPDASPALQELLEQCLEPDPANRPPTAVEVYLRLQELGKASGILLLPPGAMDRLVAARKANEPTALYQPPAGAKNLRRVLIALVVLLGLLALLVLGKWLYGLAFTALPSSGPEKVLGVQLGDSLEFVEKNLRLSRTEVGNPWNKPEVRPFLGQVLKPADLGLADGELGHLLVRYNPGERPTAVVFYKEAVIAVVAAERGASTARGVRINDNVSRIYKLYPEGGRSEDVTLTSGGHVEVRRYNELGIGFEIGAAQVTGMTLFPPRK